LKIKSPAIKTTTAVVIINRYIGPVDHIIKEKVAPKKKSKKKKYTPPHCQDKKMGCIWWISLQVSPSSWLILLPPK
jgi:hypothetical protein